MKNRILSYFCSIHTWWILVRIEAVLTSIHTLLVHVRGSNEYPQFVFGSSNKKKTNTLNYDLLKPPD